MNDRPAALCVPMCARSPEVCAQLDWKKEMQTDSDFLCCQSRTRLLLLSPLRSRPPFGSSYVGKQTVCLRFVSSLPPFFPQTESNPVFS